MGLTFEQKLYVLKYAAAKVDEESKQESPAFEGSDIHEEAKRVESGKIVSFDDAKQGKNTANVPNPLVQKKASAFPFKPAGIKPAGGMKPPSSSINGKKRPDLADTAVAERKP